MIYFPHNDLVVFDGKEWYNGQHNKSVNEVTLQQFLIGKTYPTVNYQYRDTTDFRVELSEFNIWGNTLSIDVMKKITGNCVNQNFNVFSDDCAMK